MIRPWRTTGTRDLVCTPIFRLTARSSAHPDRPDRGGEFFVIEAPEWVNIIPLTADDRVILVEQYRHGRGAVSLEIPGGMVDRGDADPEAAARRELLEETGYGAGRLEAIGSISPNPAIQTNLCHTFLATELEQRGVPASDGSEEIEIRSVELCQIPAMIRAGQITHALVVVAFCHLLGLPGLRGRLRE